MHTTLLKGIRVLELGARTAVRTCSGLLGHAGAAVTTFDASGIPLDAAGLNQAVLGADILITSSDACPAPAFEAARRSALRAGSVMICNITGGGLSGPYSRDAYTDAEIQAITGLMDTTGFPGAAPVPIGLPYCEVSAGIYAAAATTAALVAWRRDGLLQDVDVSLYGAATNALTTFLPHVFAGKDPHRIGNRHSSAAPWNAYRCADGWVLICTSSHEQWQRLAALIGDVALTASDYATPRGRVANAEQLDLLIGQWTQRMATSDCVRLCAVADIPAGPVLSLAQLVDEPNIRHRGMIAADARAATPAGWTAGAPFRMSPWPIAAGKAPFSVCAAAHARAPIGGAGPLAGFRVVEIGQYTTAPLVGKHLAALGAEVVKIEPPGGDPTRDWPHGQGDTSYFFALSNTDKVSVTADLKTDAGKDTLRELLARADVFVENLRPGAMARLGFGPRELAELNPGLVYCSISGFGATSAYPGRPAFDTVIQAMSGFMDLTRSAGIPTKAGISAADILSGQMALFSVIAALLQRDQSGAGATIDLAMQDVAVWATSTCWDEPPQPGRVLRCADGYLLVDGSSPADTELASLSRSDAVALCARHLVRAVPVNSVAELLRDPHFRAHAVGLGLDSAGRFWPVLSPPYRYSYSPGPKGRVLAGAAV
jgi:crotonobetainyl-CoA:carnitine CoA-transferase CaiB-like acyl-CoA transferase